MPAAPRLPPRPDHATIRNPSAAFSLAAPAATTHSGKFQKEGNTVKVYVCWRSFSEREVGQAGMSQHSTVRTNKENPAFITLLDPARQFCSTATYSFTQCFWSVLEEPKEDDDPRQTAIRESMHECFNGSMNSSHQTHQKSHARCREN